MENILLKKGLKIVYSRSTFHFYDDVNFSMQRWRWIARAPNLWASLGCDCTSCVMKAPCVSARNAKTCSAFMQIRCCGPTTTTKFSVTSNQASETSSWDNITWTIASTFPRARLIRRRDAYPMSGSRRYLESINRVEAKRDLGRIQAGSTVTSDPAFDSDLEESLIT